MAKEQRLKHELDSSNGHQTLTQCASAQGDKLAGAGADRPMVAASISEVRKAAIPNRAVVRRNRRLVPDSRSTRRGV